MNSTLKQACVIMLVLVLTNIITIAVHVSSVDDYQRDLQYKKIEADDKRRERDTCFGWVKEKDGKITKLEDDLHKCEYAAAEKVETEPPNVKYSEIFNIEAAGVISTNVVLYALTDAELKKRCNTDWELAIAKNYAGAKLVDYSLLELSHSRAGSMYLMTCYWLIPSKLWCNKGKSPP